ncbi:hypothetical protein DERF_014408 [Dermatophagoides farinae]|uniref:Uncharacterized protein n=1 Tax=Dermatophagoides farinae TaxID=6954 RepID=A0A922HP16_DERFA|nr:hypothetical protein DERF_014408 [Dermatophagoides farinae]
MPEMKKIETFHHRQRLSTTTTAEAVEIIGIKLDQIRWSKCNEKKIEHLFPSSLWQIFAV